MSDAIAQPEQMASRVAPMSPCSLWYQISKEKGCNLFVLTKSIVRINMQNCAHRFIGMKQKDT